jgi:hypothetical protein
VRIKHLALLLIVALSLSACGTLEVSKKELSKQVSAKLSEKQLKPTSMKCAKGLKGKVGSKATCKFTANGLDYTVHVKATKVKGKTVSFNLNVPPPAIVPPKTLETQVKTLVGDKVSSGIDTVKCPDALPGTVGKSVDCVITAVDGTKINVGVTVTTADLYSVNFSIDQK